ncbi:MAG: DUF3786 domain-containing protein [Clostridia bacterium]|nr:DUF3786 domain-containing protein [Clostridia bacterium]
MEIQDNIKEVPFAHYEELFSKLDPKEAEVRSGAKYSDGTFSLEFLFDEYKITWPEFSVTSENDRAICLNDLKAKTFLMRILLEFERRMSLGTFKTFREMSWGEMYIEPFTGRCIKRAAFSFGTCVPKFCAACEALGARRVDHGDAGYEFEVLPNYFIQILTWEGDDEFPPNSQILYSDNFEGSFAAEDRVVMAEMLITLIKNKMKELN